MKTATVALLAGAALGDRVRFDNHKLLRFFPDAEQVASFHSVVDSLDLDVFGHAEGGVDVRVTPQQMGAVAQSGLKYTVVDENLQDTYGNVVEELVCHESTDECLDSFYEQYQTLDVFSAKLDDMTDRFSAVTNMTIGTSYEGRDLKGVILSSGGSGKQQVFYNCGTHSREWIPPFFCVYLADMIGQGYDERDPEVVALLDEFDIHLVPHANPDGFEYTHSSNSMWRLSRKPNRDNSFGTDLNRNFCYQWGTGGSSSIPGSQTFMGYECFDNAESKALADYAEQVRPIAYMDIHAYGYMWMTPYGFKPNSACRTDPRACGVDSDADYNDQMACGEASRQAAYDAEGGNFAVGPITWVIYQASGSTVDHIYNHFGAKYSYALEVRGNGFQPNPSNIMPSNRELYAATLAQLEYISQHDGQGKFKRSVEEPRME